MSGARVSRACQSEASRVSISTYILGILEHAVADCLFQSLEVFVEEALVFNEHCGYEELTMDEAVMSVTQQRGAGKAVRLEENRRQ